MTIRRSKNKRLEEQISNKLVMIQEVGNSKNSSHVNRWASHESLNEHLNEFFMH